MNLNRNLIWLIPVLFFVSAPVWWPMAGQLLKPRGDFDAPPPPDITPLKSFVMEGVVLVQNRGDREEFTLNAAKINSGIHEDVLEMEDIKAHLFDSEGRPAVLTGGEAIYHTSREIITVLDDVRVKTPEGQELRTPALRYLVKYRKVKTAEDVKFVDDGLSVTGHNMFYDLMENQLRVGGGVVVDLY